MGITDIFLFLGEWFRNPRSVAAIAPSGRALASLITRNITARTGKVLELGPGTGAFTQALIERGVREENLTLIECSPDFARLLEARFPRARLLEMNAEQLNRLTLSDIPVGAIVCGLGLLNMSHQRVASIMKGAFSCLKSGGEFFLFTYGAACPVHKSILAELGLEAKRLGRAYLNLPPAAVYRITRRAEETMA
jgi:phospholipid N-methyltransferase